MPSRVATMDAVTPTAGHEIRPEVIKTRLGVMECAVWGEGPVVLSLHGAMGGYDQGVLLARTVTLPRFRIVAVSRPGYLGTPLRNGRTPEAQADLCAALLDELGLRKAAVIAISGGGPAALQFALRHKDLCAGLAMISACTGRLDVPIPVQWQIMKLISLIPGVTNRPLKKIAQNPERAAARSISDVELRRQTVQDPEAGPLMLALQMSTMDRMLRRISGTENDIRQSRMEMDYPLEQIASPTLVVHGTKDSMVPFFQAQSLAARVPGARLLAIEGGEHVAIFTNLSQVRERTTCFLDSLGR